MEPGAFLPQIMTGMINAQMEKAIVAAWMPKTTPTPDTATQTA
jgi:hypothetical protein